MVRCRTNCGVGGLKSEKVTGEIFFKLGVLNHVIILPGDKSTHSEAEHVSIVCRSFCILQSNHSPSARLNVHRHDQPLTSVKHHIQCLLDGSACIIISL